MTCQPQETVAAILVPKPPKKITKARDQVVPPVPQAPSPPAPATALQYTCCFIHQGPVPISLVTVATINQVPELLFICVDCNN